MDQVTLHAADILAMISFRGKQIVAAIDSSAAGTPLPKPEVLAETLREMQMLTEQLIPLLMADA